MLVLVVLPAHSGCVWLRDGDQTLSSQIRAPLRRVSDRSVFHRRRRHRAHCLPTMPLEATMMIIDNSEYMRNGDYQPTRFEAQADAVNVVFQTKTDSNPENTVGVMTMANKG